MLTIRPATVDDIPLIRELCFQVWPQTYAAILPPAQIEFMLAWMYNEDTLRQQIKEGVHWLLCFDGNDGVGFAAVTDHGKGEFKLDKIYILPAHQGKQAGRRMLEHITALIKPLGAHSLTLQVNRRNPAKRFYEKNGFVVKEAKCTDIGQGFVMDDYVMELNIQ